MEPTGASSAAPRELGHGAWMRIAGDEYSRLLTLLRGLALEQWEAPTECDGWAVRDIVAHLAGAAASTASVPELLRQAWQARRLGREGDLVDRMNRVQVAERRSLAPAALVDDLGRQAARGVRARRRLPGPVRAVRLPFGPPLGTRPLGYLMDRIYTRDAWMHRVDLARATGSALELTAEHDGAIVEDVVAEWVAGLETSYDVRLGGPAGGTWRSGASPADVVVDLDAIEFARTLSRRAVGVGSLARGVPF